MLDLDGRGHLTNDAPEAAERLIGHILQLTEYCASLSV
jgi:hypothetical protein